MKVSFKARIISFVLCIIMFSVSVSAVSPEKENIKVTVTASEKAWNIVENFDDSRLTITDGIHQGLEHKVSDGMQKIYTSDKLELYLNNQTTEFAVKNLESGAVWLSSPADTEKDKIASGNNLSVLRSNVMVDFYDASGSLTTYDSYTYSVALGNFDCKLEDNGFSVIYKIGKQKDVTSADVPNVIYADRFEKFLSKMDTKTAGDVKARYRLYSVGSAKSESLKKKIIEEYPTAVNGDIYVLRNKKDAMLSFIYQSLNDAGYSKDDLEADNEEHNIQAELEENISFTVKLIVSINNNQLIAAIDCGDISMSGKTLPTAIHILPYFGAANIASRGYMLVPDGSGGLIYLNEPSNKSQRISFPIYGLDNTLRSSDSASVVQNNCMPVFGLKNSDEAFLAVIKSGDGVASVNSCMPGLNNSYNAIWASFSVNPRDTFSVAEGAAQSILYPSKPYSGEISVSYQFLSGDNADYIGMAQKYREYLQNSGILQNQLQSMENIPFLLETIGIVEADASFLGLFKYRKKVVMTTYEQTDTIISALNEDGINNIFLNLSGWTSDGLNYSAGDKIKVSRKLGGKTGFKKLLNSMREKNIPVFASVNMQTVIEPSIFYSKKNNVSRQLGNVYLTKFPLNLATGEQDLNGNESFWLTPHKYLSLVPIIDSFFEKNQLFGVCVEGFGDTLYSDFSNRNISTRDDSKEYVSETINSLNEKYQVMVKGGNVYTLKGADIISDIPLSTSGYRCIDEEVPFYQTVVHGYIPYSGSPWNHTDDIDTYRLRCIEYGAIPYYQWSYKESSAIKETKQKEYYALCYRDWYEEVVKEYEEYNKALSMTASSAIVGHTKLTDGLFKTDFSCGISVMVNYNDYTIKYNDVVISPLSWITLSVGVN